MSKDKNEPIKQAIEVQKRARRAAWMDGDTEGVKALTTKIEQNEERLT